MELKELAVLTILGGVGIMLFSPTPQGHAAAQQKLNSAGEVFGDIVGHTAGIVTPAQAAAAIRSGRWNDIKGKKISRWFFWWEVFTGRGDADRRRAAADIAILENARKHAERMDRLRDIVGPISIASWVRFSGSATRHPRGLATDISGSRDKLARIAKAAIQQMGWTSGIGFTVTSSASVWKLHLDSTGQASWGYNAHGDDISATVGQILANAERFA